MEGNFLDIENFLLIDEEDLPADEYNKRVKLANVLTENVPREVFENLSIFQPSVGCLNLCSFCSQESGPFIRFLDSSSLRTLAGGFRGAIHRLKISYISCHREYKPGVIFPYLDNDIATYPYLLDYLIAMNSLGVKTRISTVGWSRYNHDLNHMHRKIVNDYQHLLSEVRFSLTPYAIGFKKNPDEFIKDFAASLSIYKPLFGKYDSSSAYIDICCHPDIISENVIVQHAYGCLTIQCDEYLLIVRNVNSTTQADAVQIIGTLEEWDKPFINHLMNTGETTEVREGIVVELGNFHSFKNEDGMYYAFIPHKATDNTDGVFYYPRTESRASGVMDARWPLRVFLSDKMLKLYEITDYTDVAQSCESHILETLRYSPRRAKYLSRELFPLVEKLCRIFSLIDVEPKIGFNKDIIRDRGIIRNSGRAYSEFKKIASAPNIMVVPDPVLSSNSAKEVWRIFPELNTPSEIPDSWYGKKSKPCADCVLEAANGVILTILAVDSASHTNEDKSGKHRRALYIPIGEFVHPMITITFEQGKKQKFIPGISLVQDE